MAPCFVLLLLSSTWGLLRPRWAPNSTAGGCRAAPCLASLGAGGAAASPAHPPQAEQTEQFASPREALFPVLESHVISTQHFRRLSGDEGSLVAPVPRSGSQQHFSGASRAVAVLAPALQLHKPPRSLHRQDTGPGMPAAGLLLPPGMGSGSLQGTRTSPPAQPQPAQAA